MSNELKDLSVGSLNEAAEAPVKTAAKKLTASQKAANAKRMAQKRATDKAATKVERNEDTDPQATLESILAANGITSDQLERYSRSQLENLTQGLTNSREVMENVDAEGLSDAWTGDTNPLLSIGITRKLPPVLAKNPEQCHFFWASIASNAVFPVALLRAKGCAYATVNDVAISYADVAQMSADSDRIRIEEMVLMKTHKKHWEALMTELHHNKPAFSQAEIYDNNKRNDLIGGMVKEDGANAFNINTQGSLYGAAQLVKAPRPGNWKHVAE